MDYELRDAVAVLRFDDGKANVIGHAFMDGMSEGLDQALAEAKAVAIVGKVGTFSGGFDLNEVRKGPSEARSIMEKGAHMLYRLFTHPQPVVAACTGHAIAAGAFLLLSVDSRIGTSGEFKIGLNETSINATFPVFGVELARARLNPAYLTRSFVQSELFTPEVAVRAGFLDDLESPDAIVEASLEKAASLSQLPAKAYAKNKLDIRQLAIQAIRQSLN